MTSTWPPEPSHLQKSSTLPNVMARWAWQSPSSAHCERNTTFHPSNRHWYYTQIKKTNKKIICIFIKFFFLKKPDNWGEKGGVQSCKIQLRKHIVGVLGKRHQTISERLRNPFKATMLIIDGRCHHRCVCSVGYSHEGAPLWETFLFDQLVCN